jgi:hypothetical protein
MSYRIPKGLRTLSCFLGLLACVATILLGFDHPDGVDVGSNIRYVVSIAVGNLMLIAPVGLLWWYQKTNRT